jgi:hypothetical protein
MLRVVLTERVKRHLQFAGTEERLVPKLKTLELNRNEPYTCG